MEKLSRIMNALCRTVWGARPASHYVVLIIGAFAFDSVAQAEDAAPDPAREVAKADSRPKLASLDPRIVKSRPPAAPMPLTLLAPNAPRVDDSIQDAARLRSNQARRIAARYSIQALRAIPRPNRSEYEQPERNEIEKPKAVPGIDPSSKLREWNGDFTDWADDDPGLGFYHPDLVTRVAPRLSRRELGLRRLASKIATRHLRKLMRKRVSDRMEQDPGMHWLDYKAQKDAIWRVGREHHNENQESYAEFRSGVLSNDTENIEENIDLLDWGALRLDDSGSLGLDLKTLVRDKELVDDIDIVESDEPKGESLFSGKSYSFDTDFRFTPHGTGLLSGDMRDFFGTMRGKVSLDFHDSFFGRKYMSTELEASFKVDGETAVFFNIVLYGN